MPEMQAEQSQIRVTTKNARFDLNTDLLPPPTEGQVRRVGRLFGRGWVDGTPFEDLVVDVSRRLRRLVAFKRKDRVRVIAQLVYALIEGRSTETARSFLASEDGENWLRQRVVAISSNSHEGSLSGKNTHLISNQPNTSGHIAREHVDKTKEALACRETSQHYLLSLRSALREIVDTTPKCALSIIGRHNNTGSSFINKCKAYVEDKTDSPWDWWPFDSRIPDLPQESSLLKWELCGESMYTIVSESETDALRYILDDIHIGCSQPCAHRKSQADKIERGWQWGSLSMFSGSLIRILVYPWTSFLSYFVSTTYASSAQNSRSGSSSKAQQRYTPTSSIILQPSSGSNSQGSVGASPSGSSNTGAGASSHTTATVSHSSLGAPCVVFGVRDWQGFYAIENVDTVTYSDDSTFFYELKLRHRKYCGRLQRWLSPLVFRYCRFVQFEEVLHALISCVGDALPDDHGYAKFYEYDPRGAAVTNPVIKPGVFSTLLRACDPHCSWEYFPDWIHKCRPIPAHRHYLPQIPQKKGIYRSVTAGPAAAQAFGRSDRVAFGLQASYLPSFLRIFVYHVILILSGFAFWIYWLKHYPADLQNASVPLFTIVTLIGTFWALLGNRIGNT